MKSIGLLFGGLCFSLLLSCNSTSVGDPNRPSSNIGLKSRINQSPDKFSRLSSAQQETVSEGRIAKGMTKEAVRLAWGKPDQVRETGSREQWIYYRPEQAYLDYPYTLFTHVNRREAYDENAGRSHSRNDRYTVQQINRTVVFANGKAVSWTRVRD